MPETEPALPRRRGKKAAAQTELACLMLTGDEYAVLLLSIEEGKEEAAIRMGWAVEEVQALIESPKAKLFMVKMQDSWAELIAQRKMARFVRKGITPGSVQERFMELAMMEPERTKGTIEGQVKALRSLAEMMGLLGHNQEDPLKNKSVDELKEYVRTFAAKTINAEPRGA